MAWDQSASSSTPESLARAQTITHSEMLYNFVKRNPRLALRQLAND